MIIFKFFLKPSLLDFRKIFKLTVTQLTHLVLRFYFGGKINEPFCYGNALNLAHEFFMIILTRKFCKIFLLKLCVKFHAFSTQNYFLFSKMRRLEEKWRIRIYSLSDLVCFRKS